MFMYKYKKTHKVFRALGLKELLDLILMLKLPGKL